MRILLVGEYSRLHLTLAEGLQSLGHEVVVASDGDGHKQYARDIDLTRKSSGIKDTAIALWKTREAFKQFKNFDVVQINNPCFLTLSVSLNRYFFDQLKKNNKKIFLGAFGDDSYWVKACMENKTFKYSEFFVDGKSTNLKYNKILINKWLNSSREKLNQYIANRVDGIAACLYEYYMSYKPYYEDKLRYIPLPINCDIIPLDKMEDTPQKIKFFLGIDKIRSEYKGTDRIKDVLLQFTAKHPNETEAVIVESVSYEEYQKLMKDSHVLIDQLYSYSPSMNPLQAMAQGRVVISGGEPEMYDLIKKGIDNRPIINVYPTKAGIEKALEEVLNKRDKLQGLSLQSRLFVEQYHDYKDITQQYLSFWMSV